MNIYTVQGNLYIDAPFRDYLNNIWVTYDQKIDPESNIYFFKNTTINRLVTDYTGKNISRVIKKSKADYGIIKKINIGSYPQYYDGNFITNDDTKEVVYGIYNLKSEEIDTIHTVLEFYNNKQPLKFVNQDRLIDSLNNGFVIDEDNYHTIKELVDSDFTENKVLSVSMLVNSDMEKNWQWIIYLYFEKYSIITAHDSKQIITNYFNTLGLKYSIVEILTNIDKALDVITNPEVQKRFIQLVRHRFEKGLDNYIKSLGTNKFITIDFKIDYDPNKE